MSHTIDDRILELADEYTLNHSDEDYLSNKAMLNEFKQEMIARTCEWMRNHNAGEDVIEQYVKDMEE